MHPVPTNFRDLEATDEEWLVIPEKERLAICVEHGYRKRRAAPQVAPPATVAPASKPPVLSAVKTTPTPITLAPQRPPTLEESIAREWFGEGSTIRERFASFADFVSFRLAAAEGTPFAKARASGVRGISQADYDAVRALEEDRVCGVDPRLPLEARAERVWQTSPSVRAEFDRRDGYLAYRRALERRR